MPESFYPLIHQTWNTA